MPSVSFSVSPKNPKWIRKNTEDTPHRRLRFSVRRPQISALWAAVACARPKRRLPGQLDAQNGGFVGFPPSQRYHQK